MNSKTMHNLVAHLLHGYEEGSLPPLLRDSLTVFLSNPAFRCIGVDPSRSLASVLYLARKNTITGKMAICPDPGEAVPLMLAGVVEALKDYLDGSWTSRVETALFYGEPVPIVVMLAGLKEYQTAKKAELLADPFNTVLTKLTLGCFDYKSTAGPTQVNEGLLKPVLFQECKLGGHLPEAEDLWYRCWRHTDDYPEVVRLFYTFESMIKRN